MKNELKADTVAVKNIKQAQLNRMYELFTDYYKNHTFETFYSDLQEKHHVILLYDKHTRIIQGFSTLLKVPLKKANKNVLGVYSGDTVVNRNYWGSPALGIEFLKYLWKLKMKRPGLPVYWFLITKGYKTYLLMAKNFTTFYPRYEEQTPNVYQTLMDSFYSQKFADHYRPELGLIINEGEACALKEKVADITEENLLEPNIAFFQQKNPQWAKGHELTCIAKMTIWMPVKYFLKKTLSARSL